MNPRSLYYTIASIAALTAPAFASDWAGRTMFDTSIADQPTAPISLTSCKGWSNDSKAFSILQVTYKNSGTEEVDAVRVSFTPTDSFGEMQGTVITGDDRNKVSPGITQPATFRDVLDWTRPAPAKVTCAIEKVLLADGTIWTRPKPGQ